MGERFCNKQWKNYFAISNGSFYLQEAMEELFCNKQYEKIHVGSTAGDIRQVH